MDYRTSSQLCQTNSKWEPGCVDRWLVSTDDQTRRKQLKQRDIPATQCLKIFLLQQVPVFWERTIINIVMLQSSVASTTIGRGVIYSTLLHGEMDQVDLAPGRQFGNFGAAGFAWIFTNEDFFKQLSPTVSFGKIRASYGTTGSDAISNYQYMNTYSSTTYPYNGVSGLKNNKAG